MATATKSTKSQIQAELDAALERINQLEAAQAETRVEANCLEQTVWLSKNAPSQEWSRGTTKSGKPFIRFGAQYSARNENGERTFGCWKNYVAYGQVALHVEETYAGTDRLVHIVAFESPSHGRGERSNERYTEWVVKEFRPVARLDSATPEPAQAPAAEPTTEEIPF